MNIDKPVIAPGSLADVMSKWAYSMNPYSEQFSRRDMSDLVVSVKKLQKHFDQGKQL